MRYDTHIFHGSGWPIQKFGRATSAVEVCVRRHDPKVGLGAGEEVVLTGCVRQLLWFYYHYYCLEDL